MRITTQMLNETARKAGMPVNNSSLLNYVNNKNNNSLLSNLQNGMTQKSDLAKRTSYEKLEAATDALDDAAKALTNEKKDNLFSKAKESGDTTEIIKTVKALIEKYNETRKQLGNNTSSINMCYSELLKQIASKNGDALSELGISMEKDGSLTVDEEKLKAAKVEDLENVFGAKSEFVQKLQYMASNISDSVEAELKSMGNQYGQDANAFSSYISNKYNLWG